jgi:cytoskeletal protein CcmA (bactofilin family)
MFRRREETTPPTPQTPTTARVTTVLGGGISIKGNLGGSGSVRIDGGYEGDINLSGMLVIGETGRVTCEQITANVVVVSGAVKGNITAEKVEIRASGRVWGDVTAAAFSTEEGAFLKGRIQMEEDVEIEVDDVLEAEEPED